MKLTAGGGRPQLIAGVGQTRYKNIEVCVVTGELDAEAKAQALARMRAWRAANPPSDEPPPTEKRRVPIESVDDRPYQVGEDARVDELASMLERAVPASMAQLIEMSGCNTLVGYALCTDADMQTLYAAGLCNQDEHTIRLKSALLAPAEWPLEDHQSEMSLVSTAISQWMGSKYEAEGKGVGPGDDHLRPWKRKLYFRFAEVLAKHRAAGTFAKETAVLFVCHDPNDGMDAWIRKAQAQLNSPAIYTAWLEAWDG